MTDPNWLPSTLAQSTAALVAIVGGFLVSRLVTLSSERGALAHRRKDLMARRELFEQQRQEADQERLRVCVEWLWDLGLNDIVKAHGQVDLDAQLDDWVPRGSDVEEMRPYVEDLVAEVQTAFTRVQATYSGSAFPTDEVEQLRQDLGEIPTGYEEVYIKVARQAATERRARSSPSIAGLYDLQTWQPSSITPTATVQRHDANIARVKERIADAAAIDSEVQLIDEEQVRFTRPEGLIAGLWVLGFFAVLGIILPMIYMALRPVPADPVARGVLIGAFVVGFVVLVVYLIVYLRRLQGSLSEDASDSGTRIKQSCRRRNGA